MKFGSVPNPETIDFSLPTDHPDTKKILSQTKDDPSPLEVFVGCAKWSKTELKGFYPRGTKDELTYYSRQFNSIELNATHYNVPRKEQVLIWKEKTPEGFRFFPKIPQTISHFKRLIDVQSDTEQFIDHLSMLEEKLGTVFLQVHDNFQPKNFDRLEKFVTEFPAGIPLGIEVRNEAWFTGSTADSFHSLLAKNEVANIIVDTAGRRDMLHMRLSSPEAFVRFVGANVSSDYSRLDEWVDRLYQWKELGLKKLHFFVHQNIELESPLLSAYFIKKLNERLKLSLPIPAANENPLGL